MAATNGSTASFWMLLRFDPFVQPGPAVLEVPMMLAARLLAARIPLKGLFAVPAALDMARRKPAAIVPITFTFLASHALCVRGEAALPTATFKLLANTAMSSCKVATLPGHDPSASALANAAVSLAIALLVQAGSTATPLAFAKASHLTTWEATLPTALNLAAAHGFVVWQPRSGSNVQ